MNKKWVICQYCHKNIYSNQQRDKIPGIPYFMHHYCYLKSIVEGGEKTMDEKKIRKTRRDKGQKRMKYGPRNAKKNIPLKENLGTEKTCSEDVNSHSFSE